MSAATAPAEARGIVRTTLALHPVVHHALAEESGRSGVPMRDILLDSVSLRVSKTAIRRHLASIRWGAGYRQFAVHLHPEDCRVLDAAAARVDACRKAPTTDAGRRPSRSLGATVHLAEALGLDLHEEQ